MASGGKGREGARTILIVTNMWPSGRDPVFGTFVKRQVDALRGLGMPVRVVANTDQRGGSWSVAKYAWLALRASLAGLRGADVVVGHYLYPTAAIARTAARFARCPYVLVAHGTDVASAQLPGRAARASRAALRHAELVVTVSRALERRLRVELALPADVPTAVVHMGIDRDRFRPDAGARERLGWAADERVALFVGNLVPTKGLGTLVEAFEKLAERDACDRLVLVGAGPLEADLRSWVGSCGVADRVTFAGLVSADQVATHMAAADVLVLPSRAEGLGLVLYEAMACGTPCVATRVGGIPEVLDAPSCGRLVPPDDAPALAAAIAEVVEAGRQSFSAACMAAAADAGADRQAERFVEALGEAMGWGA